MAINNSDFSSNSRQDNGYYPLNNLSETMFLIEAESRETTLDRTDDSQSSVKGVMFALGVIVALIIGSTWQLYRCLKVNPVNSQLITPTALSERLLLTKNNIN